MYLHYTFRGHSTTTYTNIWLFLTTHLPLVDRHRHLDNQPTLVYIDISTMTTPYQENTYVPILVQKNERYLNHNLLILSYHISSNFTFFLQGLWKVATFEIDKHRAKVFCWALDFLVHRIHQVCTLYNLNSFKSSSRWVTLKDLYFEI